MKEVQLMKVVFDAQIAPHETPAFRGAIIEKVGLDKDVYHNHNNDPESPQALHYRYPLVQYRQNRRRPELIFLESAIPQAQYLFAQPDWSLTFAGRPQSMRIADMKVRRHAFGVADRFFTYTLHRWQALNEENFKRFLAVESLSQRVAMLERILCGHIISFAKGMEHRLESRFDLSITDFRRSQVQSFEGIKVRTFDMQFKTNVLLPPYIALGKGVSVGFGEVVRVNDRPDSNHNNPQQVWARR